MFHLSLLSSFFDRIEYGENGDKYYLYEEVWADYAKDSLSSVFMYAAIALAVILIGIGIFVKFKNPVRFAAFVKTALTVSVTFALTVIVTMLALGFDKIAEKGYAQEKAMLLELVPPLVLGGTIVAGIAACYIASLYSRKVYKITLITSLSVIAAALVAVIVCLVIFFAKRISGDGYYDSPEYGKLNQVGL